MQHRGRPKCGHFLNVRRLKPAATVFFQSLENKYLNPGTLESFFDLIMALFLQNKRNEIASI